MGQTPPPHSPPVRTDYYTDIKYIGVQEPFLSFCWSRAKSLLKDRVCSSFHSIYDSHCHTLTCGGGGKEKRNVFMNKRNSIVFVFFFKKYYTAANIINKPLQSAQYKICFPHRTLFQFHCPRRPASAVVLGRLSLRACLW